MTFIQCRRRYFLRAKAKFIRLETIRLIEIAKTGHYSSVSSAAEIFAALYYAVMSLRSGEPKWPPDRDRFLMGKGHAAVGQFPSSPISAFFPRPGSTTIRAWAARWATTPTCATCRASTSRPALSGMPCRGRSACVSPSASPGGAIRSSRCWATARCRRARSGRRPFQAAAHRARNLIAIVDRNGFDGRVDDVIGVEPLDEKWRAFGWEVHAVDGHDVTAVTECLAV